MGSNPFDEKAATWDSDPAHVKRAVLVAECIANQVRLDPSMRTLEYGAGTGLVSEELQDKVGPMTLVDTSAGMRSVIESKVETGRLPQVRIDDFDVSTEDLPYLEFDLIVTVLTLHHIPDLSAALIGFNQLLSDGGTLCIVDLDAEDGSFHGEGFGGHHGFQRDALSRSLRLAGFTSVSFSDCHSIERDDGTYSMFLAVTSVSSK